MAVTFTLVPWPNEGTVGETEAIDFLHEELGRQFSRNVLTVAGREASNAVYHYAPDAPRVTKNSACIRCISWLIEHPASGIRREQTGDVSTSYFGGLSPLRESGAQSMLSPYKIRRAGAI